MNYGLFSKISKEEAKIISPVTLAFVGDAVYSLFVRQNLVLESDSSAAVLQKTASEKVSAQGQNKLLEKILPLLTPEEEAVFKRGRNAKKTTRSKHATVLEYNNSTGIEAVIGYLYLSGEYDRIAELLGGIE